ncbi:hypothetical protein GCM10019059_32350 [Camelimonas fluminis]|uniref:Terminase small subunit protein n=1 Tax=Camelimonas fluminis TaxID=1576911 RepID=A0ABV7UI39_9HYPH|nr:terminase small subunit protein [Camelimonas fluminis]GHE70078.1 hypothetical protein GCM10019059_32350 [Camelimonas fluminis]
MTDAPKPGRPTEYSAEVADIICERIADGESLRDICKADEMPARSVVFRWLSIHREFSDQYARAREAQADAISDDMLAIADDGQNDWIERNGEGDEDAGWRVNGEHIQRSRLRIDARKWMAAKLAPKKYGDRQSVDHTSSDGSMAPTVIQLVPMTGNDDSAD